MCKTVFGKTANIHLSGFIRYVWHKCPKINTYVFTGFHFKIIFLKDRTKKLNIKDLQKVGKGKDEIFWLIEHKRNH